MSFSVPKFIFLEDFVGPEIIATDSIMRVYVLNCELVIEFKTGEDSTGLRRSTYEEALAAFHNLSSILIEAS